MALDSEHRKLEDYMQEQYEWYELSAELHAVHVAVIFISSGVHRLLQDFRNIDRSVIDWVIVYYHSPCYCSNRSHYNVGLRFRKRFEKLLVHHADLVLNGHVHAYERTHPVFEGRAQAGGLVHITTGISGSSQGLYGRWAEKPEWSAFRESVSNGFGYLEFHNRTHLVWRLVQVAVNNASRELIDEYWIKKPTSLPSWRHDPSSPLAYPDWNAGWDQEKEDEAERKREEDQLAATAAARKRAAAAFESSRSNPNGQFGTVGLVFMILIVAVVAVLLFDYQQRRQERQRHFVAHPKDV